MRALSGCGMGVCAALLLAVLLAPGCGGEDSTTTGVKDAGKDTSSGGTGGGSTGGSAGTVTGGSAGTVTGGTAGADAATDAADDAPQEAQGCTDAGTTFGCSALLTGAQISYDPTNSEVVIQLPSSFPNIKHVSAHTDVFYGTSNTTCDSFSYDISPPSTTIHIPFSATTYPNLDNIWVRDLELTDECDAVHALDAAATGGCEEPHAKAGTPPTIACEQDPDPNCTWECS